ncbi:MAG: sugar ABC transporter permease [Caldilineaceae bacterium]|nr:sugar ABC transporter permease [Caldilineaceae bacterium]
MTHTQNRILLLFLTPALLMIFVFTVIPSAWAIYISFTDLALAGPKALDYTFTGLKNYTKLFGDRNFLHSLSLSIQYTIYTNIGQFTLGMIAALILHRRKLWGQGVLLAVIVLPMVIPGITQALIWSSMLGAKEFGTLNRLVGLFGVEPILWTRTYPMLSIVLVNFWNNSGFAMILFLAGLESIPKEIIESATIDGANGWQRFRNVTLPMVSPVILFNFITGIIGSFQVFTPAYIISNGEGGPAYASMFYVLYLYLNAFRRYRFGYASAQAWLLFIVILVLTILALRASRAAVYYESPGDDKTV